MSSPRYKTAKVIKEYVIEFKGWTLTIPVGSTVSNSTALGFSDDYRFWQPSRDYIKALTGSERSMLWHDLTYYGLNIPAEFCEPYPD